MTQSHDAARNLYGSLQVMKFIEVLNLANNNIKDLSTVLQQLSIFRSLRQLGEIVESLNPTCISRSSDLKFGMNRFIR